MRAITPDNGETATGISYPTFTHAIVTRGDIQSETFYDGLGRPFEQRKVMADGSVSKMTVDYDSMSRPFRKSDWFQTGQTPVYTVTEFDGLGRPVKTTAPDGAESTTAYKGLATASTIKKINGVTGNDSTTTQYADGFGRLIMVDAPEGAGAVYRFDLLGRLTKVNLVPSLGATPISSYINNSYTDHQVRTFTFDLLGRQTSATNPETDSWKRRLDALGNALLIEDENGRARATNCATPSMPRGGF